MRMGETDLKHDTTAGGERLPYEAPEVVDCGDVVGVTQTTGFNPGGDGAYS